MPTGDGGLVSIIGILSVFVGRRPPKPGRTARRGGTYDMNAGVLQRALTHLDSNLAACQLGITVSSLALGWIGEPALANLTEPLLGSLGISATLSAHAIAIATAFIIITVLHIVLGELAAWHCSGAKQRRC
jgi:putative hemolysin